MYTGASMTGRSVVGFLLDMTIDLPVSDLLPLYKLIINPVVRAQLPKFISRFSSYWASLRDMKTHHYGTDGGRGWAVFRTRGGGSVSFLF